MKKLPYGISNYEKLIEKGYYYIDKTEYIEKIENLPEQSIMILRPRKFGKTLFTSTLEYYYDINAKEKFEKLFKDTYIGRNPTNLRNTYHILRFNFSGIDTKTEEATINGFKKSIITSIELFVGRYGLDFSVNKDDEAERILDNLLTAFYLQKSGEKIYVIIDEYDHFANELLGFNTNKFKELVSRNGKVRKWYEILKKGTESVVDRIFITGVAPITLDSLTSGFNISTDETRDRDFNEMLGFTQDEVKQIMEELEIDDKTQKELMPIMKENYDGYKFSIKGAERMYNSNMCLYFLNQYSKHREMPESLIDVNIASDYSKLSSMLELCKGESRLEILKSAISGEGIITSIVEKFNPEVEFREEEFVSMLFYLGYLTITGEWLGKAKLNIPNLIMKELYSSYFMQTISKMANLIIQEKDNNDIIEEIAIRGEIGKLTEILHTYLNNLSNRDYQKFDEKYVKIMCYSILMNLKFFSVTSELEANRNYIDLLVTPKDKNNGYKSVMIEFKYLKKEEENLLEKKKKEAKEQIERYAQTEEIKDIQDLSKYTVVAVNDEIYVDKID